MAAISRYAGLLDGLSGDLYERPGYADRMRVVLETGVHRSAAGNARDFTTAYLHTAGELRGEIAEGGLELVELLAVEGPASIGDVADRAWGDPDRRAILLDILETIEAEPDLLAASQHWLAVAR